jgi:hypothetical protein
MARNLRPTSDSFMAGGGSFRLEKKASARRPQPLAVAPAGIEPTFDV